MVSRTQPLVADQIAPCGTVLASDLARGWNPERFNLLPKCLAAPPVPHGRRLRDVPRAAIKLSTPAHLVSEVLCCVLELSEPILDIWHCSDVSRSAVLRCPQPLD